MKNALSWKKGFLVFGLIVLSMLFILGCSDDNKTIRIPDDNDEQNTYYPGKAEIVTADTIAWGAVNPTVVITAIDFQFDVNITAADLQVDPGTTNLQLFQVTWLNATQIRVALTGTAAYGEVLIEADTYDTDTLSIVIPPHITSADTIPCDAVDPAVTVTVDDGLDFQAGITVGDMTVDTGTTGLTFDSVIYVNATEITIVFTGTAEGGRVSIQANGSAFVADDEEEDDSNILVFGVCDPVDPWATIATADNWLTNNPYFDKHDGGWVYSPREDVLYAFYGNDAGTTGRNLYRIDHIGQTFTLATVLTYGRHGSHPVIDDTGTYIYLPPSQQTNVLERYNTVTFTLETLAGAPANGTFAHGAWKNGKLWIVLNNNQLYNYDPASNTWTGVHGFSSWANVASSGPASDLVYVIVVGGALYSHNTVTDTTTILASHPYGFSLGGNGQFVWFGTTIGYLYAMGGCSGTPAMYDIGANTWHAMADPKPNSNCVGHATYDTLRQRLYVAHGNSSAFYYQY
ncbi:MAG: hypothetical protein JXO48_12800 [Deltaproteobacteria bacterium]|nr:hypothetical protein [Deltaproteobacteria bacterium]